MQLVRSRPQARPEVGGLATAAFAPSLVTSERPQWGRKQMGSFPTFVPISSLTATGPTADIGSGLRRTAIIQPSSHPQRRLRIHPQRFFCLAMHRQRAADPDRVDKVITFGGVGVGWMRMPKPPGFSISQAWRRSRWRRRPGLAPAARPARRQLPRRTRNALLCPPPARTTAASHLTPPPRLHRSQ